VGHHLRQSPPEKDRQELEERENVNAKECEQRRMVYLDHSRSIITNKGLNILSVCHLLLMSALLEKSRRRKLGDLECDRKQKEKENEECDLPWEMRMRERGEKRGEERKKERLSE